MNENKAVELVKQIARDDWIDYCKRINTNTLYNEQRKWKKYNLKTGYGFGLEGTPDKAFVVVNKKAGVVRAVRSNGDVYVEIKFDKTEI